DHPARSARAVARRARTPGRRREGRPRPRRSMTEYRSQLSGAADVVDPEHWAGELPTAYGTAPRLRVGRSRWFNLVYLVPIALGALLVAVAAAQGLRNVPAVHRFI